MMLCKKKIVTISILFFVVTFSYSQVELNLYEMKEQAAVNKIESEAKNNFNQSVYILQIGENNYNSISANFNQGSINVFQDGNSNDSSIVKAGDNIFQNVYQKGNNNLFYDYSVLPVSNVNMNINQMGSDLSIYSSGSNSISNSLSINQKGSNQMVIILNN